MKAEQEIYNTTIDSFGNIVTDAGGRPEFIFTSGELS